MSRDIDIRNGIYIVFLETVLWQLHLLIYRIYTDRRVNYQTYSSTQLILARQVREWRS